jgi:hypothetical protein
MRQRACTWQKERSARTSAAPAAVSKRRPDRAGYPPTMQSPSGDQNTPAEGATDPTNGKCRCAARITGAAPGMGEGEAYLAAAAAGLEAAEAGHTETRNCSVVYCK